MLVTSNKGGVDSEDVVITGAEDPSAQVVATITGDTNAVQMGQAVSLDGLRVDRHDHELRLVGHSHCRGDAHRHRFGADVHRDRSRRVHGLDDRHRSGAGYTSTDTFKITVSDASATPVADAGPDQMGVVPTSTVTLDGTGSKFASTFSLGPDRRTGGHAEQRHDRQPDVRGPVGDDERRRSRSR